MTKDKVKTIIVLSNKENKIGHICEFNAFSRSKVSRVMKKVNPKRMNFVENFVPEKKIRSTSIPIKKSESLGRLRSLSARA